MIFYEFKKKLDIQEKINVYIKKSKKEKKNIYIFETDRH